MIKTVIEPNLICITSPAMDNNSYIILHDQGAIIIDPSFNGDDIIATIPKNCTKVDILLTHAHFDHCFDVAKIANKYNATVYMHKLEKETYTKYRYDNLADMKVQDFSNHITYIDTTFGGKNSILLGNKNITIQVTHTPGHSAGSVVYQYKNWVFVGDTLFYNSYGRTDLGNSNPIDMIKSLNHLWKELKDDDFILTGHNRWGTFKQIKRDNFIVQEIIK